MRNRIMVCSTTHTHTHTPDNVVKCQVQNSNQTHIMCVLQKELPASMLKLEMLLPGTDITSCTHTHPAGRERKRERERGREREREVVRERERESYTD